MLNINIGDITKKKLEKVILGGMFVSIPVLTMAATTVVITDGNPNTELTCLQKGVEVSGNGSVKVTIASLSCLQGSSTIEDSDQDGYSNTVEIAEGTDPNDSSSVPADNDGDKNPDSTDLDDDNDGYADTVEISEGSDPKDASSKPADLDNDKIPDSTDTDIDGDGYTNSEEAAAGSDPRNPNSIPVIVAPDSLDRESDIVNKFNNDYYAYVSKSQLNPQTLSSGKKVYIVNQGYGSATSVPSCVNGKYMQTGCKPTGWTMGMVSSEVFAVRYMTKEVFNTGSILFAANGKSRGAVTRANYKYNISDKPGDMTGNPYPGRCSIVSENADGGLYVTTPGKQPYVSWGFYCEVPKNTVFYLNVEVADDSKAKCDSGLCSGYINVNGFNTPKNIKDGATF